MSRSLQGRRALVCGSTRGIGRACAERFAADGARVTLFARDEPALARVCEQLPGDGHHAIAADFRDPSAVATALDAHLEASASAGPIHVLVNNTGGPPAGPLLDAEPEAFRIAFNAHVVCAQLLARAVVPGMKEAGYGRIVNIISTSVKTPLENLGVSNTIRAAVASWAKTLAGELAPFGVTVNNVLPGATATDRLRSLIAGRAEREQVAEEEIERAMQREIPAGRFASPEEIAGAVAFLASPDASYISGINLPVDGGRTSCL